MSQWIARDTRLASHLPGAADSTFGSFRDLVAKLYLEARVSPRTLDRWVVSPPDNASVTEMSELRNLGLRVENRGWVSHVGGPILPAQTETRV